MIKMKNVLDKVQCAVFIIDSGFERFMRFFWYVGGLLVVLMAFVLAYGAVARYVFRSPVAVTYDITCILMFSCVAFCIPYTQKLGKHLRLDLFDNIFPKAVTEIIVKVVGPLLGLIFGGVLTWKCWENSFFALKIAEATNSINPIPTFPLKIMFTFFAGMLCLIFVLQLLRYPFDVRKRRNEKKISESAQEEQ